MLYSVVDDRSGVAYQEYHCAYGEDVETALKFLFSAMAPKADARFPFCGRPHALYLDNGPVARSQVFHQVMGYLDATQARLAEVFLVGAGADHVDLVLDITGNQLAVATHASL
jgi:hypothetical protein